MLLGLDVIVMIAAFLAAFLWAIASRKQLRRVSHNEVIDEADLNRIIVSFNRTQVLNARAALATAIEALAAGSRHALQLSGLF